MTALINFSASFKTQTIAISSLAILGMMVYLSSFGAKQAGLFLIGTALGIVLYHASFGFTGAYTRAIREKDISGVSAQLVMLALAMILFAPVLSNGEAFGHGVVGAIAPVSVSMAFGAFIFGIGMQLGGGCASGTLFTSGGGNPRMLLVLIFFCAGAFWGSLDLQWWNQLPRFKSIALSREFGWAVAIPLQLFLLLIIYLGLRALGGRNKQPLWWKKENNVKPFKVSLLQGPWPLLLAGVLLALLNWATLLVAGHPWSITWAFSLWGAKAAVLLGWDATTSGFWSGRFQEAALMRSILQDNTSIMNIGILLGAFLAAALAGKFIPRMNLSLRSTGSAIVGGLLLGYGARLAYGCNIGAFFSGIASTSLHGWVWIFCAIPGNLIGLRLKGILK